MTEAPTRILAKTDYDGEIDGQWIDADAPRPHSFGHYFDEYILATEHDRLMAEKDVEWSSWCIIEVAVRNPSVSDYMKHWEGRAEKAEARVAELEARPTLTTHAGQAVILPSDYDVVRRAAFEEAAREADNHLPRDMWEARDSTIEYNQACRDIAAAIRALAEKG